MATVHYTAKVKDSRLLELPEEAQELGLKPGEEVTVTVEHNGIQAAGTNPPNEKMLAALAEIAELNKGRPFSDDSDTQRLLREARAGAMYDRDPTE
ncbi:MAG TPA: hypothetical protein VFA07_02690 [Chthonomonadaceae bacterium]|nr:hypothetical protein [Chthonomonadaceae bacterium]